jgi:dTDP-4-dehydrorhamnose reductase
VLEANPKSIVARVNFYGWSLSGRRSLAEFFHHNLTNNKSMSGYTDVIFCPLHAAHLGQTLLKMLAQGLHGLYHVVGTQPMSKYQFGVEIARRFKLNDGEISPKSIQSSSLVARRAHNLYLSVNKLSTDLGESLPSFSAGLDLFYAQFKEGFPQKLKSFTQ